MCNQAFYALKRFRESGKFSRKFFLPRQMSRMVLGNCSFSTPPEGWWRQKRGVDGRALHKSCKHCRYDLINISHNVAPCNQNNTENFHFVLRHFSFITGKLFYCIKIFFLLSHSSVASKRGKARRSFDYFSPTRRTSKLQSASLMEL